QRGRRRARVSTQSRPTQCLPPVLNGIRAKNKSARQRPGPVTRVKPLTGPMTHASSRLPNAFAPDGGGNEGRCRGRAALLALGADDELVDVPQVAIDICLLPVGKSHLLTDLLRRAVRGVDA